MEFNTKKKKLTVWLTKVPKYIGEQIMNQRKGTIIGNIEVDKTENQSPSLKIRFSNLILNGGIPKEHVIEIKDKPSTMYIVSTNNNDNKNRRMDVEGLVNKECFIRPVLNKEYLEYKRKQKAKEEFEEEKVQVIDYFSEVKRSAKYSVLKEMDTLARKRKLMLQGKKRERLEKSDVMEIVFNAFEKHSFWTVKDLADFSGQPIAYIQEIVNEICVMNKKDHKNTYELKPEYKQ